jgi:hypothetical protein
LGRAVTIALWRANNKPPVELVVANLRFFEINDKRKQAEATPENGAVSACFVVCSFS